MVVRPSSDPRSQDAGISGPNPKLMELREKIDAVDVAIHDLLLRRAGIVAEVRQAKSGGPALRPGREAQILRRLAKRHAPHAKEGIGLANILRMWREMIDSLTTFQSAFSMGLVASSGETTQSYPLRDVVRDHYGSFTPLSLYTDADQVLAAVQEGTVTLGIVPYPTAETLWWMTLPLRQLQIVARLPFFVPENHSVKPGDTGFVVAAFSAEPSGLDRSLIVINSRGSWQKDDKSLSRLASAWPDAVVVAADKKGNSLLIDVPGFIENPEAIPKKALNFLDVTSTAVHILGNYAVPLYDPQGSL